MSSRACCLRLILFALLGTVSAWSQRPGGQQEAYFPPDPRPKATPGERRRFKNLLRELRKGSGPDRVIVRDKLMREYGTLIGAMLTTLREGSANHFEQRQVCLVLMQVGDARALDALKRLSGAGKGGTRGLAGLALGRMGDASAVPALESLSRSGQPMERMMAYLALGKIGGRAATSTLLRRMVERKLPAREQEALVIGLGLTGSTDVAPTLARILEDRGNDRLRRAAAVGAGYLDPSVVFELLEKRVDPRTEEDKTVRIIALRGISRLAADPARYRALRARRKNVFSDADEEAAWVHALAALGGTAEFRKIAEAHARSQREEVREALAASTVVIGGREADKVARALRAGGEKDRVVRAALLAGLVHAAREGGGLLLQLFANHSDEQVRRIALCGEVYLRGAAADKVLRGYLRPEFKDDVRDLAKRLLEEVAADERTARMLCRARLQKLLDDNGLAASWNLNRSATERLYEIFDIVNATTRRGSGQPPGASSSGRPAAASALGPSPEQEDLRRHLDRFPYIDVRHRIELPPVS